MLSQILTMLTTPVVFLALDRLFHGDKHRQVGEVN